MTQAINLGSINIDYVYTVDRFVRPGETLASSEYEIFAGGKGFNQSVALARAGAATRHIGAIGKDSSWLLDRLANEGVDIANVEVSDMATGHAIIQVAPNGENAILLHSGANHSLNPSSVAKAVSKGSKNDILLLQNETSCVAEAMRLGKEQGMQVVFNSAPMNPAVRDYPLDCVDVFILNETEAEGLTGKASVEAVRDEMRRLYPEATTVLTLGEDGVLYCDANAELRQSAFPVEAVDTTAAGDTFIGYFLAEWMKGSPPAEALSVGCRAASICVTRAGAAKSIPFREELK